MSDYCLTLTQQFSSYIMAKTSYDDEVRFVLDQHALLLDFNSASTPKWQSADIHVAPLGHIILIPNRPVFALTP